MPGHAFFCSITAAVVMGIPLPLRYERATELHVAVPAPQRALRGRGIVGHKLQFERSLVIDFDGIRVSNAAGTWCQLGSILTVPDLVAAGDYLVHRSRPMVTITELRCALEAYPGRRGKPALRDAIELLNPLSESPQESRLRVILTEGGLNGFEANVEILTSGGYRYRGDLVLSERKLILEYQGAHHLEPERFRRDMTRTSRLEADGWFVMQINADDLRNPGELLSRIRRALAQRPVFA